MREVFPIVVHFAHRVPRTTPKLIVTFNLKVNGRYDMLLMALQDCEQQCAALGQAWVLASCTPCQGLTILR